MRDYDTWVFTNPQDCEDHEIGLEDGEQCGRFCEPCEDAPRNYRPRPCGGLMIEDEHGDVTCESCGESA